MNYLLRPRIWPSFLASSGVPSTGSGQAPPATYRSGTPRNQPPAVARWHAHLHDLATAIHEISGLKLYYLSLSDNLSPELGQPLSHDLKSGKTKLPYRPVIGLRIIKHGQQLIFQ